MSLINRMLRDLDAREASEQERAGLAPRVRALPARLACRCPPRVICLLTAAGIGGGLAWWLMPTSPPPPVETPPLPALVVPLPAAGSTKGKPAAGTERPAGEEAFALRVDTELSQWPEPLPEAPPATGAVPKPIAPPSAPPVASAAKVSPVGTASGEAVRPTAPTAENDTAPPARTPPLPTGRPVNPPVAAEADTLASTGPAAASEGEGRIERQLRGGPAQEAAEAEYRRALALLRRGAATEAQAALEVALTLYPAHANARQTLLALLVDSRQFEQAATVARNGLALDGRQSGWAMILARLQVEQGDLTAAAATLARHAAAASANGDYAAFRGYLHYRLQDMDAAIAHYRTALSLKPQEGRWWYGLGLALEAAQRPDEALAAFRAARDSGTLSAELLETARMRLE